jgi:hypothetical protein
MMTVVFEKFMSVLTVCFDRWRPVSGELGEAGVGQRMLDQSFDNIGRDRRDIGPSSLKAMSDGLVVSHPAGRTRSTPGSSR